MIDKGPKFQFEYKEIAKTDDLMRLDSINQLRLG
jgi:hypothetical protein